MLNELKELGVKDSKLLSPLRRESMYGEIVELCSAVHISCAQPAEIDRYVKRGRKYRRLNYLEARHMARVIDALKPAEVFVDAPDTNPPRFTAELRDLLSSSTFARNPRIVAEHKADSTYAVVSAASIVAKVERDRALEKLRIEHGDFGSGYPSDAQTVSYLVDYVRRERSYPPFARRSWKTWDRILVGSLVEAAQPV